MRDLDEIMAWLVEQREGFRAALDHSGLPAERQVLAGVHGAG